MDNIKTQPQTVDTEYTFTSEHIFASLFEFRILDVSRKLGKHPTLYRMKRSRFKLQVMLILILVGCATVKNNCDNGLREEKSNSSQTLKAIRYGRSCRHGDSVSLNISILPNNTSMPNSEGNILIANFKAGTMNLFVTDTSVLIAWLNDSTLQLTLDKGLHVVKKESSFGEAKVVYQAK